MKRSARSILQELRSKRDTCSIHEMTFAPCNEDDKANMEKHQRERFITWWDSWVVPLLDEMEKKVSKPTTQSGKGEV